MSSAANQITAEYGKPSYGLITIFAALVLPTFILRILQLIETDSSFGIGDIRGFSADLIVICILIVLLSVVKCLPLSKLKLPLLIFIPVFWCSLTYGNYEHIKALGAMSSWAYMAFLLDPTFVNGSLLHASHPWLLGLMIIVTLGFSWYSVRTSSSLYFSLKYVALILLPTVLIFFLLSHSSVADWRKNNHFIYNIAWSQSSSTVSPAAIAIPGLYPYDLDGKPVIDVGKPDTNVLLLVLEGVSGAYIDRIAEAHSISGERPNLQALNEFGENNLVYLNFINHQRQTNRGLYSLICGDLPKQRTSAPKMSVYGASGESRDCLPQMLNQEGYQTTFIQSAPLAFMGKDKFMPAAGFSNTFGTEWFDNNSAKGEWGVDDNILFKATGDYIENELEKDERPWFLTVLTSGTHHPFTVPADFKSEHTTGSFSHAIDYLDISLGSFLDRLEKSGILENTLLVITSDESFGRDQTDDLSELLRSQAFGSLTISTPNGDAQTIREPFLQMDIAISILDFLGYTDSTGDAAGRSVFREYSEKRSLPFANTYLRTSAMISEKGDLVTCKEDLSSCEAFKLESDLLMSSAKTKVTVTPDSVDRMRQILQRSFYTGLEGSKSVWELAKTGEPIDIETLRLNNTNETDAKRVLIFGDQYLSVPAGSTIRVELDFDVIGEDVNVKLRHRLHAVPEDEMPTGLEYSYFTSSKKHREAKGIEGESTLGMRPRFQRRDYLFKERWRGKSGSNFKIEYSYTVDEPFERLNCMLDIKNEGPSLDVSLKFNKARLTIEKMNESSEEGLTVTEFLKNHKT